MAARQTLARDMRFEGITLHRGVVVAVRLLPAPANSGIVFRRVDAGVDIRSDCHKVSDTRLATTLSENDVSVSTVEHFLSALSALAIDDIIVELDGEELPILDGSAAPWFVLLRACGITANKETTRRAIRVLQKVEVQEGARRVSWSPLLANSNNTAAQPIYEAQIDFPHSVVRNTECYFEHVLTAAAYEQDISRARTFCYVNDVETMQRNQRALGGSLQNAIVIDDEKVINKDGLRYPNEFVRHKILDAIGDSYINGTPILGKYESHSPGHDLNNQLMRHLIDTPDAWEWTSEGL